MGETAVDYPLVSLPPSLPGVSSHARQRAIERYGQDLDPADWLQVWIDIVEGKSLFSHMQGAAEIHIVDVASAPDLQLVKVAYLRDCGLIVTTLPVVERPQPEPRPRPRRKTPRQFKQLEE
jgi:hypothetical protein